jgi:hypothetical protein
LDWGRDAVKVTAKEEDGGGVRGEAGNSVASSQGKSRGDLGEAGKSVASPRPRPGASCSLSNVFRPGSSSGPEKLAGPIVPLDCNPWIKQSSSSSWASRFATGGAALSTELSQPSWFFFCEEMCRILSAAFFLNKLMNAFWNHWV